MSAESTHVVDALLARYTLVGGIVGVLVLGYLIIAALLHYRKDRPREPADAPRAGAAQPSRGKPGVIVAMVVVIALILFPLAIGTRSSHEHLESPHEAPDLVLEVVGFRYGWAVKYPGGYEGLNEVRLPAGQLVRLDVTSMDVMHKFHVAEYRTGVDAMPGKVNQLFLTVNEPGTLAVVHCAELCGPGHALMKATIRVMEADAFQEWLAVQQAPASGAAPQVVNVTITDAGIETSQARLMAQVPLLLRIHNGAVGSRALNLSGAWTNQTDSLAPAGETTLLLDPVSSPGTLKLQAQDEAGAGGPAAELVVVQPLRAIATLEEFAIAPQPDHFLAGAAVLLTVTNVGVIPHDLHLALGEHEFSATPVLSGSGSALLAFWMPAEGKVEAWCALPGHADGGMRATLEVTA